MDKLNEIIKILKEATDKLKPYENSEDLFYDILPLDDGKLIKLYIHKANIGFIERKRDYASHYLEQVFDNQNNLISEIIKENPYYKK